MKSSKRVAMVALAAALLAAVFALVAHGAAGPVAPSANEVQPSIEKDGVNRDVPNSRSSAHLDASHAPSSAGLAVSGGTATGTEGLNFFDQRYADGANQFSLEPPDQGLCTGNGIVIEAVNDVFTIKSGFSKPSLADSNSLTVFFTGQHQIVRHPDGTATYGPFLSDPKCYYDPGTGRFFMTILKIGQDPSTGAFLGQSAELLAVSKSSAPSPSRGDWFFYSVDTTDNGGDAVDSGGTTPPATRALPQNAGCPCFGDQPLIGADKYGFYITSNEFSIAGSEFNGAQIYAMDKVALENGALKLQRLDGGPLLEGPSYTVQPATSPTAASWDTSHGGTEYFLSALDFDATLDNRIATWALTNTSSLVSGIGTVKLSNEVLTSEAYGQPPNAEQKIGPTPLAQIIEQAYGAKNPKSSVAAKEELLAGNDDRMNQVVYAAGNLWSGVNTVIKTQNGPTNVGIAYFVVKPGVNSAGAVAGSSITNQGYVAVNRENVMYPAIGVTADGKGVMTYTLTGPDYYPSAGYTVFASATSGPDAVHVAGAGVGPDDGFTGYPPFGGPEGRWGDYSAAVADATGTVWFATEYIAQSCTLAQFSADPTCGGTRGFLANWSTYVGSVKP